MFLIKKYKLNLQVRKKFIGTKLKKIHLYQIKNSLIPFAALVGSLVF